MKGSFIADCIRIPSAIVLVALEFTALMPFVAEGGAISRTVQHSRFPVYFAAYGIGALLLALDLRSAKRLLDSPLVRWSFAALLLFTWGMFVRMFHAPAGIDDYDFFRKFGLRVNGIGFVLCCTIIFDNTKTLQITKRAVVVGTLAGVALNIYDLMFPGTFSAIPGRAAGLYVQPNTSGMALVFGCVIGVSVMRRRWWQEAFILVGFIGVVATFSRESILAFGFVVVGGILSGRLSLRTLVVAGCVGGAFLGVLKLGNSRSSDSIVSNENWSRITSHVFDASARDRIVLAKETLSAFEEAPLLGQGFGTTSYWEDTESHNFYLSLLADHGIIGILLIPALLLSIRRRSWDFYSFAAVFLVWCLFSHLIFDDAAGLISLAIQAAERYTQQLAYYRKPLSLGLLEDLTS
jgi:hypothetical protein